MSNVARQLHNRKVIHAKRLYKAYQAGIGEVYDMTITGIGQGKGKKAIPSKEVIAKTLYKHAAPAYVSLIEQGLFAGLSDVEKVYGKPLPITKLEKAITMDDVRRLGIVTTIQEIRDKGMKLIVLPEISETMRMAMAGTFEYATRANMSVDEIKRLFQAQAELDKAWQAKRIAQTETTRAFNASTLEGYRASTVAKGKRWETYMAGRPRATHEALNGTEVGLDEKFVTFTGVELDAPGDFNAPPEEVVNCHCGITPVIRL